MISPILNFESKVQVKDRTRFNAEKTFKTQGENAFSACTIQPGANGTPVNVFVADDQTAWYLDWVWGDAKFDIDAALHKLYFKRQSTGVEYATTLTTGTYTFAALVAEILIQLNAASAVVWTATLGEKDKISLTASESVEIQFNKNPTINLWPLIGFPMKYTGKDFVGETIEAGLRKVILSISTSDFADPGPPVVTTVTESYYQRVYTVYGDSLFSNDSDMRIHEANILNWVPVGRSSWLDAHRRSQETILNWIYQAGHTDNQGRRLTKFDIFDMEDVRLWSMFETLRYLFMSFQNSNDDVFKEKSKEYEKEMLAARNQATLKLDKKKNGNVATADVVNTESGTLFRL